MALTERALKRKNDRLQAKNNNKKLKKALSSFNNKVDPKIHYEDTNESAEGKTLFESIAVFDSGLSEEQLDGFIHAKKFTIIDLKDITEPGIYECPVYYPFVDLKIILSIVVEKSKTKIFIIANEDNKMLLVNTFYNFYNIVEMVQITAYHVGREIHNYFEQLFEKDIQNQLELSNNILMVEEN